MTAILRNYKACIFTSLILYTCFSCTQDNDKLFTLRGENYSGIDFSNLIQESNDFNVIKYPYFYNGGGVCAADFNNDGFSDLFFVGNLVQNKLYINKGNGKTQFYDATPNSGLEIDDGWDTGVCVVDINDDGWMDIYVSRSAATSAKLRENLLFINQGDLTFKESASEYGLNDSGYSTQATFFDFDNDGDLDCFVMNHNVPQNASFSSVQKSKRKEESLKFASHLYRNEGNRFLDCTSESGLSINPLNFGLGLAVGDINNDGWQDLFVGNDFYEGDYLYINQGDGTFKNDTTAMDYQSLFSMGCDLGDINRDGYLDLITLDMLPSGTKRIKMTSGDDNYNKYDKLVSEGFSKQFMRNMLFINGEVINKGNTEDFHFIETGQFSGISNTDWSWSALFSDLDNDGRQDIFITNGYERDYTNMEFLNYTMDAQLKGEEISEMEIIEKMPSINVPNYFFKNNGDLRFTDVSSKWSSDKPTLSNGAIAVDLDNDGDLDLVTNNVNSPASLYLNNSENSAKTNYISVNFSDIHFSKVVSSRVKVYADGEIFWRENQLARGFQSSSYTPVLIGLGDRNKIDSIVIYFSDGTRYKSEDCPINSTIKVDAKTNKTANNPVLEKRNKWTVNQTFNLEITQWSSTDFKNYPYLLSTQTNNHPTMDVNKDTSLLLISGFENQLPWIVNANSGQASELKLLDNYAINRAVFYRHDNKEEIIVASKKPDEQETLYLSAFTMSGKLISKHKLDDCPLLPSSINVLSDSGHGRLKLFVGSAGAPGMIDFPSPSVVIEHTGQKWEKIRDLDLGSVNSSEMVDYDSDGKKDILLSRPWQQSIVLFHSDNFEVEHSTDLGKSGLWNAIRSITINEETYVLNGNIGLNNQLQVESPTGLNLYYSTCDNGSIPVYTIKEEGKQYPFFARDEMLQHCTSIKKEFTDYSSYAEATIEDIFGPAITDSAYGSVEDYHTTITLLNGEKIKLPEEIQLTSIYDAAAIDINGDGKDDLLLGGNDYEYRVRIGEMSFPGLVILHNEGNKKYSFQGYIPIDGQIRQIRSLKSQVFVLTREGRLFTINLNQNGSGLL